MEIDERVSLVLVLIGVLILALGCMGYFQLLSLYQVPSVTNHLSVFDEYRTKWDDEAEGDASDSVNVLKDVSVTNPTLMRKYADYYVEWRAWYFPFTYQFHAWVDLSFSGEFSGSELLKTFGPFSFNTTDPSRSTQNETVIVETTWWIHRFKGYVEFRVDGTIRGERHGGPSTNKRPITERIKAWTRVRDGLVRFRMSIPDIMENSDFDGLMGMWVLEYQVRDHQEGYSTAQVSPWERQSEIVLRDSEGAPLLWSFPFNYEPSEQGDIAFLPFDVVPTDAYFDILINDFGPIPVPVEEGAIDYRLPRGRLYFYVDVLSTAHKLFTIPEYEVPEEMAEKDWDYTPIVPPPSDQFLSWLQQNLLLLVIVGGAITTIGILAWYKQKS